MPSARRPFIKVLENKNDPLSSFPKSLNYASKTTTNARFQPSFFENGMAYPNEDELDNLSVSPGMFLFYVSHHKDWWSDSLSATFP